MKTVALIVAGGSSSRLGGEVPKQFRSLAEKPLLSWTISKFEAAGSVDQIVVAVPEEYLLYTSEKVIDPYDFKKVSKIVIGGATRQETVSRGLKALPISTSLVAIHDAARPLVTPGDIDHVVSVAQKERAAILAEKATDTIKRSAGGFIVTTLDRNSLYLAQTPQVFQFDLILKAHRELETQANGVSTITDDASLIERAGFKVRIVEATSPNFKVTTPTDLLLAETLLKGQVWTTTE